MNSGPTRPRMAARARCMGNLLAGGGLAELVDGEVDAELLERRLDARQHGAGALVHPVEVVEPNRDAARLDVRMVALHVPVEDEGQVGVDLVLELLQALVGAVPGT